MSLMDAPLSRLPLACLHVGLFCAVLRWPCLAMHSGRGQPGPVDEWWSMHRPAICPVHTPLHSDKLPANDGLMLLRPPKPRPLLSIPPGLESLPVRRDGRHCPQTTVSQRFILSQCI